MSRGSHGTARGPTTRTTLVAAAGLLVVAAALLPWTRVGGSILVETLQFALLAFGVTPLIVLACSPRLSFTPIPMRKLRVLIPVALIMFIATTAFWRLPVAVNGLAHHPVIFVAEALTVVAGTGGLWTLVLGASSAASLPRPFRIVLSAFAIWSVWIFAYAVGFSGHPFYRAYAASSSPVTMQEWSVVALWATSTVSFAPAIFTNLFRWLSNEQVIAEREDELFRRSRLRVLDSVRADRPVDRTWERAMFHDR